MSNQYTIVGAKWCGYSQKQAESLGCKPDNDGKMTCAAKNVNFVWCQDDKGQPMNTQNKACKVPTQGYPTWTTKTDNGEFQADDKIKGFTDGCKVPGLDQKQLKCTERQEAMGICQKAEQAVKTEMTTKDTEGYQLQQALEKKTEKLQKGMEEYMKSNQMITDLQKKMKQAKNDMQIHMKKLEKTQKLPELKNKLTAHIQNLEPVKKCQTALKEAQPFQEM